jgi:hypothetical protein
LTGGGPETTIHGELHAKDEVAGVVGHTVVQAYGFSCGRRHAVMAELRCSRTTATAVADAVGNVRSSARGEQRGEQSGARAWRLLRERRGTGPWHGRYAG